MFDPHCLLVAQSEAAGGATVSIPTQWLIYAALAIGAVIWLRSGRSNPTLDTVRRLLASVLNWPEPSAVDHIHEDPLSRIACVQELASWLRENGHDAKATQLMALVPLLIEEE